jgi:predicted dehydrogenase
MWGSELLAGWGDVVELVGICDTNHLRAERARAMMGSDAPILADFADLLERTGPDCAIICTPDYLHDDFIVAALEAGADVIAEKPMTTTPAKIARILEAETRTGRKVDVSFNYRFAPTAHKLKSLIAKGEIGEVTAVDFHWYLDTAHGADYFRRWHAYSDKSGSLFVHKATHHFDLLNWYLASDPVEVKAFGEQRVYGKAGPFRGERCRTCPHKGECDYFFDITKDDFLSALYEDPSQVDGYVRDACVFRSDIDIPDTMTASIRYASGALVSYSLNTYMPVEGYHLAFNGTRGRIEIRMYERQPWETPAADEILLVRNFGGGVERIEVPHAPGGHYGGDDIMRDTLFRGRPDPLGQRAGSRAGALSVLTGVAALTSARESRSVAITEIAPAGVV